MCTCTRNLMSEITIIIQMVKKAIQDLEIPILDVDPGLLDQLRLQLQKIMSSPDQLYIEQCSSDIIINWDMTFERLTSRTILY